MTFKNAKKKLLDNSWVLTRTKGSHYMFEHSANTYLAVVPCHKDISIGVLKSLEKGTNLKLR